MVFQPKSVDFNSRHNPSQAFTEKHVLYPQLTASLLMSTSESLVRQKTKSRRGEIDVAKIKEIDDVYKFILPNHT